MKRYREKLAYDYRFRLFPDGGCDEAVYTPAYDDSDWQTVRVPHDWAADGEFHITNDVSYNEVAADSIDRPIKHSGRTGGLPIVGLGVYRRTIDIAAEDRGSAITLEFDGVMWESHVYVNGKHVHFNHFGYKSFSVDITDYIEYGKSNLIAVSAEVFRDCSRWYPGAGIYRHVYLVKKAASHINFNGIWVRQTEVALDSANFELSVDYTGPESLTFHADILDPNGEKVVEVSHGTYLGELSDLFTIPDVKLWDVDSPNLYTAHVTLLDEAGNALDDEVVRFGARYFEFTLNEGFFLNGRPLKLNGVCNHHDLGSLGAALNVAALRRQLNFMREMGVNAIRTSHNPPAPELLTLCDEMGFVVMDEFFDEWYRGKVANGYSKYFRAHAEEDVTDVIRRDRNHPSVILWSIGNEILEQSDPEGWRAAKFLNELCHRLDPTRPTTIGFNGSWRAYTNHLAEFVDVVGHNYKPRLYAEFRRKHPLQKLIGTETASCISTRGVYKLPAEIAIPPKTHEDLTISAYDLEAPGWGSYPEREFAAQEDLPYVVGEFVWTGMDYLGEPSPYYSEWPSRSSYFGIVDLAGIPKNRFYAYRAHWTNTPTLHIFPHWNWEGLEGQIVPVHIYTNYPEVELFVNGISQGRRVKNDPSTGEDRNMRELARYRLMWNEVTYEPGELLAVAYDAEGREAERATVRTAAAPAALTLTAERTVIAADGDDLTYFIATVVDREGIPCPLADPRIFFAAEGCGELLTTDAGDQRETESFARHDKKALSGRLVACVRSRKGQRGSLTVTATAEGLTPASLTIEAK